jgi:hypothetical protein
MKSNILDLYEPIALQVLKGPCFSFVRAHIFTGVKGTKF